MATVFDVFNKVEYQYLTIAQSRVRGDTVTAQRTLLGVFKEKGGSVQNGNMETVDSTSTLHVRPGDFPEVKSCLELIGNGISVNGQDYSIVGATTGANYDSGVVEHYRLTLQKAKFIYEQ